LATTAAQQSLAEASSVELPDDDRVSIDAEFVHTREVVA
jgi:hypothetical protein